MVWKGTSIEEAKRRFVNDLLSGECDDMSASCLPRHVAHSNRSNVTVCLS